MDIITPVAGAFIGYLTNWLAIKMLFRPHTEKHIFSIKLPFTPGLIPKERLKLSKKVAEAVGEHVLTSEVLTNELSSEATGKSIERIVNNLFEKYDIANKSINELLSMIMGGDSEYVINNIDAFIGKLLTNGEQQTSGLQGIADFLNSPEVASRVDAFILETGQNIASRLTEYQNSERFVEHIDAIKGIIIDNLPRGVQFIEDLLEKTPAADDHLRGLVFKIIDENVGSLVGLFINRQKVYANIKNGLFGFLRNSESMAAMLEPLAEKLPEMLTNGEAIKKGHDYLTRLYESEGANLRGQLIEKLNDYAGDEIVMEKLRTYLVSLARKALDVKINAIGDERVEQLKNWLIRAIKSLVIRCAPYVAQGLDIQRMVENKINDFEIAEGERIILSVVNRELKAITYVGGVLGLIIGLLPGIIDLFR